MKPFVRSEGVGPTVICLHASAGSSRQWQPLIKRLRSHYRVMAVDLYGHGLTPDWKRERSLSVDDEAALIEPLVEGVPEGVYLVGQGYGAVVALKLALAHRNRIRGLVLYEPTPFALLYADKSSQPAALEIAMLRLTIHHYLRALDRLTAAQRFVDYCSGDGSWQSLHFWQQQAMAQSMPAVQAHLDALLDDPTPLPEYAKIDAPVLCLSGSRTRAPARQLARILVRALPCARWRQLPNAELMGSVSHPEEVNRLIQDFLALRCGRLPAENGHLGAAGELAGRFESGSFLPRNNQERRQHSFAAPLSAAERTWPQCQRNDPFNRLFDIRSLFVYRDAIDGPVGDFAPQQMAKRPPLGIAPDHADHATMSDQQHAPLGVALDKR
ncbi:MAG: alpha/beta fold hydrolase [Gammaproteobacteria bacterium]